MYSTFFGGSSTENAVYSKLVNGNELVICGSTVSSNFPTTPGAISTTKKPGADMYVLHLNASGTNIIASTFLGTTADDYAHMMDVDFNNDIYISAYTSTSNTFSCTPGLYNSPTGRNTIHKLSSNLTSVIYQTKFGTQLSGSPQYLCPSAFRVDSCQNIYIAGFADGDYLPVTANKFQAYDNGQDLYIAQFNTNMLSLNFGSYFGGENYESNWGGTSYFDEEGVLYQGLLVHRGSLTLTPGGLPSTPGGLPTTPGAYQTSLTAIDTLYTVDAFVKIDLQSFIKTTSSYGPAVKACAPFTANFNSFTNTGTVSWDFGDGSPISNQQNTTHTYNSLGNYTVSLIANDSTTCNKTDTVKSIVAIVNPSQLKITGNPIICENQPAILKIETNDAVSYSWSTGATTSSISINTEGTYTATINNGGCDTKQTIDITYAQTNIGEQFPNVITPNNDGANDVINFSKYNFTKVLFTVFDRWGIEKYKTNKTDAVFNPASYTDGTYFYTLDYQTACDDSHIKTKGFITVLK
jgi:gliding motility-associated-like protein